MKEIGIALAPTGGWGEGRGNPVTPEDLARQIIAGEAEGAALVHIHSRDRTGSLTADRSEFDETAKLIRNSCSIILEASTGGLSDMSAEERVRPTGNTFADMGSLNIGSLNFADEVYRNALPDVRFWITRMRENGVKPSLEIFDTGHLETARALITEGFIEPPFIFNFIFGVNWGMPFHPGLLDYLIGRLPAGSLWGVTLIGSPGFSAHVAAAKAGATIVRCGFEDSRSIEGKMATDNPELVRALREALEVNGFRPMSGSNLRKMLNLGQP